MRTTSLPRNSSITSADASDVRTSSSQQTLASPQEGVAQGLSSVAAPYQRHVLGLSMPNVVNRHYLLEHAKKIAKREKWSEPQKEVILNALKRCLNEGGRKFELPRTAQAGYVLCVPSSLHAILERIPELADRDFGDAIVPAPRERQAETARASGDPGIRPAVRQTADGIEKLAVRDDGEETKEAASDESDSVASNAADPGSGFKRFSSVYLKSSAEERRRVTVDDDTGGGTSQSGVIPAEASETSQRPDISIADAGERLSTAVLGRHTNSLQSHLDERPVLCIPRSLSKWVHPAGDSRQPYPDSDSRFLSFEEVKVVVPNSRAPQNINALTLKMQPNNRLPDEKEENVNDVNLKKFLRPSFRSDRRVARLTIEVGSGITSKLLNKISKRYPELTSLSLIAWQFSAAEVQRFEKRFSDEAIQSFKKLNKLEFLVLKSYEDLDAEQVAPLALPSLRWISTNRTVGEDILTRVDGAFLDRVEALPKLEILDVPLYGMEFTLPARLSKVPSLRILNLSNARLSDNDLQGLCHVPNLEYLDLNDTHIRSLEHLPVMSKLQHIVMPETMVFTSSDVEKLKDLPSLVRYENLQGRISMDGFVHLSEFHGSSPKEVAASSLFSDTDFKDLTKLAELEAFEIPNDCDISSKGLKLLQEMPSLKVLRLTGRPLSKDVLLALSGLDKLEELDISGCSFAEEDFQLLAGMRSLKKLNLSEGIFAVESLRCLKDLPNLEELDLRKIELAKEDIAALQEYLGSQVVVLSGFPYVQRYTPPSTVSQCVIS